MTSIEIMVRIDWGIFAAYTPKKWESFSQFLGECPSFAEFSQNYAVVILRFFFMVFCGILVFVFVRIWI